MLGGKKERKGRNNNNNDGNGRKKDGKGTKRCECDVLITSSANAVDRLVKVQDAISWINDFANRAIRINEAKRLLDKFPSELLPAVTAKARELINLHESMQTYIKSAQKQLEEAQREGAQRVMSEKFTNSDVPGAAVEEESELQRLLWQRKLMYGSVPMAIYLSTHNQRLRMEAINGMRERLSAGSTSTAFVQLLFDSTTKRFFALYTSPVASVYVAFKLTDLSTVSDISVLEESRLGEFITGNYITVMPKMHHTDVMVNVLGMSGTPLSPRSPRGTAYGGGARRAKITDPVTKRKTAAKRSVRTSLTHR